MSTTAATYERQHITVPKCTQANVKTFHVACKTTLASFIFSFFIWRNWHCWHCQYLHRSMSWFHLRHETRKADGKQTSFLGLGFIVLRLTTSDKLPLVVDIWGAEDQPKLYISGLRLFGITQRCSLQNSLMTTMTRILPLCKTAGPALVRIRRHTPGAVNAMDDDCQQ